MSELTVGNFCFLILPKNEIEFWCYINEPELPNIK